MHRSIILSLVLFTGILFAASAEQAVIFCGNSGEVQSFDQMITRLNDFRVVFVGELHDDVISHKLELSIITSLHNADKFWNTSMEMFERDVQTVLDSYLAGNITEQVFLDSSRLWGNYQTDYRPIVEFAKANSQNVLAQMFQEDMQLLL